MIGEVANIFVNVQALSIASFWCWEPLLHSHHSPRTPSQVPLFYHFWCVDRGPDLYDSVDEHPFLNIIPIDPRRFYQSYWDSTRTIAGWWLSKTTPLQKMMDWVRQLGTFPTEWKVIIHSCSKPPIRKKNKYIHIYIILYIYIYIYYIAIFTARLPGSSPPFLVLGWRFPQATSSIVWTRHFCRTTTS